MPEYHNAFLDAYFASHAQALQDARNQQDASEFKQKLAWEQTSHMQDLQQKAQEFAQQKAYQDSVMKTTDQNRQDQLQEKQQAAREQFLKLPGVSSQPVTSGNTSTTDLAPAAVGGQGGIASPAPSPTYPNVFQKIAGTVPGGFTGGLPAQVPADADKGPTSMLNLGAGPQLPALNPQGGPMPPQQLQVNTPNPVPAGSQAVPSSLVPGSMPSGQELIRKTQGQLDLEKKQADTAGDMIDVDSGMQKILGIPGVTQVHKALIPTLEAHINAQAKIAEQKEALALNLDDKKQARQDHADLMVTLAQLKNSKGAKDPDAVNTWSQSLLENPDSVDKLTDKDMKTAVAQKLRSDYNLPIPTALKAQQQTLDDASKKTLAYAGDVENMSKDPAIATNQGMLAGRVQDLGVELGANLAYNIPPGYDKAGVMQKLQEYRTKLNYLLFGEGKAQVGGRVPQAVINYLKKSSPNIHMTPEMLAGSIQGVKDNAREQRIAIEKSHWGGDKMRPDFMKQLGNGRSVITKPDPSWTSGATAIPMDGLREKQAPDGTTVKILHDGSDGKFYEVE